MFAIAKCKEKTTNHRRNFDGAKGTGSLVAACCSVMVRPITA